MSSINIIHTFQLTKGPHSIYQMKGETLQTKDFLPPNIYFLLKKGQKDTVQQT